MRALLSLCGAQIGAVLQRFQGEGCQASNLVSQFFVQNDTVLCNQGPYVFCQAGVCEPYYSCGVIHRSIMACASALPSPFPSVMIQSLDVPGESAIFLQSWIPLPYSNSYV